MLFDRAEDVQATRSKHHIPLLILYPYLGLHHQFAGFVIHYNDPLPLSDYLRLLYSFNQAAGEKHPQPWGSFCEETERKLDFIGP